MNGNTFSKIKLSQIKYLTLPLLSGLLLIAAFPPFEQGYVTWIALIPLLATCLRTSPKHAFWAGFVFGLPLHFYTNLYLSHVLFPYLPTYLSVIAMIAIVCYISLFNGLFGLGASLAYRTGKVWFTALALPALWLLAEYLRSLSFLAYNVGYLGYTQWGYPLLLNISSVYGYWGLPFLIIYFQILVLLFYWNKLRGIMIYSLAGFFIILLAAGLFLPGLFPEHTEEKPLKVSLIQGNIHPEQVVDATRQDSVHIYLDMTRETLEQEPDLDLVVWPETVVSLNFETGAAHHQEVAGLAEKYDVNMLYGARLRDDSALYNSIVLFTKDRDDVPVYHKHRLVPFVEYFPMEELLNHLLDLDLLLGSYSPGEQLKIFQVEGIFFGGAVCFESYFGDHTRRFAEKGSRHLFVLTNDAWFGESIGLEQHAQIAAIRAAEMGIGVTQVANSGITISFDYRGRELFRSGKNEAAVFTLNLDFTSRDTLYVRYGDYFPAFWALFMVIATPVVIFRKPVRQ